ncbi:MAG: F0F1 ATP synthase subunit A [Candidatus Methylacidiphilales bacterium]
MIFAKVNPYSEELFGWFNNSMLYAVVVVVVLIAAVQLGLRSVKLVPTGFQNFCEWVVEFLYDFIGGIVGHGLVKKTFPLLASLFVFILAANWSALLPGVGTVGLGVQTDSGFVVTTPFFRPANADLNMTLALALLFMVVWLVWTIQEVGVGGFLKHTFLPKGVQGLLYFCLIPIFLFVGVIEVVSIGLRAVSLPLRLYGNIFGGKNLVHAMGDLGNSMQFEGIAAQVISIAASVPFYGLELLIGLLQALVFTMLCAVYVQLSASHEEGH